MRTSPIVHIDWEITPDEFEQLRHILLEHQATTFVQKLIENGALNQVIV